MRLSSVTITTHLTKTFCGREARGEDVLGLKRADCVLPDSPLVPKAGVEPTVCVIIVPSKCFSCVAIRKSVYRHRGVVRVGRTAL